MFRRGPSKVYVAKAILKTAGHAILKQALHSYFLAHLPAIQSQAGPNGSLARPTLKYRAPARGYGQGRRGGALRPTYGTGSRGPSAQARLKDMEYETRHLRQSTRRAHSFQHRQKRKGPGLAVDTANLCQV